MMVVYFYFLLTHSVKIYSMWKNLHARKIVVLCMLLSSLCERMKERCIKKNGKIFSLWNLLKIAYMLLTYRLEWIINQDRNYEWNLISHIYNIYTTMCKFPFSLRCRHHHHLLMLFISHSISISETNPSTSSLHIVCYFKLGVECHDGEKIGVQEKKVKKKKKKKREKDLTIWNGWSANELLNKAKAATSSEQ